MAILSQVDSLSIRFSTSHDNLDVVKNVSLLIKQGERVGLVGESGSGKSITAQSFIALIAKNGTYVSGRVTFHADDRDYDILKLTETDLANIRGKRIGLIFQEPQSALDPVLTCGKQVDEVYLTHTGSDKNLARERTLHLFKLVQLPDPERIYDSYAHQISGGQAQRVMIAIALVCDPVLLIADEPTTSLDVSIQKEIIDLIVNITQSRDMSLLLISHDLALVSQVCQRIYIMKNGMIEDEGSSNQVFYNPQSVYTRILIESRQDLDLRPIGNPLDNKKSILLSLKNVTKTFKIADFTGFVQKGSICALRDISLTLNHGEILGIVGESGSGKSTLIQCILGIQESDQGEFFLNDMNMLSNDKKSSALRRKIQAVFQDPNSSLNPKMTIRASIREALTAIHFKGDKSKQTLKMLLAVGLDEELKDRLPAQLSGGQRQRVCIARALAMNPEILLCDECTSALDVRSQSQILKLLCDIRLHKGLSIIFVTHDLSVAGYICDRILVMKDGQIVEENNARAILKEPKHEYTQKLIAAIPYFRT